MTAADWVAGTAIAGALWAFALTLLVKASRRRRTRDRRELRTAAERAYRGPHEAA
jgi:hypothetical protein